MSNVADINTSVLKVVRNLNKQVTDGKVTSIAAVVIEDGEVSYVLDAWNSDDLQLIGAIEVLKHAVLSDD